jgi:hypothetical protein
LGQYYITVNVDKRQYLDPHKFGAGLKLMEFSGQGESIGQALLILCSSGNGRGGGDLHIEDLTEKERALIGSWSGDKIVVAGDYMDPWLHVPEDLKGKTYKEGDETVRFGFRPRKKIHPDDPEFYNETLYGAARHFFEDISDQIITAVAKGGSPYHPWAAMDLIDDGWRDCPESGLLPEKTPEKPAGGRKVWKAYEKNAVPLDKHLIESLAAVVRRYPDKRANIVDLLREEFPQAFTD